MTFHVSRTLYRCVTAGRSVKISSTWSDTSSKIFMSRDAKSLRECFAVVISRFSWRHVRAPADRREIRRWWTRRRQRRRRRREYLESEARWRSLESNRRFPRMLGLNWEHEEVPQESPTRVWVFGSFFPFFFLSITLTLTIGPLSWSCLVPLSFPLRGFGLLVSVHLFAHLLLSFLTGLLSYSFVRADIVAFVGPPGPWEAVVVPSRERGGF